MIAARHHTRCAADGCQTAITRGWFCKDHYFAIPAAMRRAVLDAYNAARAGHCRLPSAEQEELNRAYGQAFRDCQDYLRRVPKTPASAMTTVAYDARDFAEKQIEGGAPKEFRFVDGRML